MYHFAVILTTMFGFDKKEMAILRTLNTPAKVQDFINSIPANFEPHGDQLKSPRRVLRERTAHCFEGALLAAAAFRVHGQDPLIMDLKASADDKDHVVALFRENGCWGAVSKTNHGVLRYRESVYRTPRELALSYFHEYFLDSGKKTLRSYSVPFNLSRFDDQQWMISEEDLWDLGAALDDARHFPILNRSQVAKLRKADPIERDMGRMTEWKRR